MQQKVLVAIDFRAPASWAVGYAVKLAARLKFPLVFMGVVSSGGDDLAAGGGLLPERLDEAHKQRLEHVVRQCQEEGVSLEIFLSSGPFFREISQLLDSPGNFKFLVMGVPQGAPLMEMEAFSAALKDLHRLFRGDILLVREQGKIARLADLEQRNQGRKP
jgi:hypothetical protein